MDDYWIVCESVEVWDGFEEDIGGGGDGCETARADWRKCREEGIIVAPYCLNLIDWLV